MRSRWGGRRPAGAGSVVRGCRWLFSPPRLGRESALRWTERLGAVTALVGSVEYLRGGSQLHRHGLNDPALLLEPRSGGSDKLVPLVTRRGTRFLHLSRIAAAVALLLPSGRRVRMVAGGHLAASTRLVMRLEARGLDGSDEVAMLVHTSTATARVVDDPAVGDAALWFLGLQSGLSYFASGAAKLASPTWTGGDALTGIFRTQAYGHRGLWQYLEARPDLARRATRAVVVGELVLPLMLLRRHRLARPYVMVAALFHAANGFAMGLGRFTMAFSGMYPAVLYISSSTADRRSDLVPRAAAALAVGAVAGSVAVKAVDHRRLSCVEPGQRRHVTARGSTLTFRVDGAAVDDGPLVVLESGLGGTADHWSAVRDGLVRRGLEVLSYNRAGYEPSTRPPGARPDLDELCVDLVDLVDAAAGTRQVVLVGHSLGGHIVVSAADRLGSRLLGVVTLDASHPEQWDRLATSMALGGRALAITEGSLRLGLGAGLDMPWEVLQADPAVRPRLLATHRAASTWNAVRWEVDAMLRAPRAAPPPVDHLLAMTASSTAQVEPTQLDADRRLAAQGRHVLVDRSSHLGLLLQPTTAATVAAQIAAYVTERLGDPAGGAGPAGVVTP